MMKTLRLLLACGLLVSVASCGNPRQNDDRMDGTDDRLFGDSVANDTATWGDTTINGDSLNSPSLP